MIMRVLLWYDPNYDLMFETRIFIVVKSGLMKNIWKSEDMLTTSYEMLIYWQTCQAFEMISSTYAYRRRLCLLRDDMTPSDFISNRGRNKDFQCSRLFCVIKFSVSRDCSKTPEYLQLGVFGPGGLGGAESRDGIRKHYRRR